MSKRPVDHWREWAGAPMPSFKVHSNTRPAGHKGPHETIWTLEEDGVVVGTWRDVDAPWLVGWMARRLGQLHGSWHVARTELGTVKRLVAQSSVATAHRRRSAAAARQERLADLAALQSEADRLRRANPMMTIKDIRAKLMAMPGANARAVRAVKVGRRRRKLPRP